MPLLFLLFAAPLDAHGAKTLELHPRNPHYFLFRGKPTVLITSGEHYGAVLNGAFDFRKYLDELKRDGLNLTRTFSGVYREVIGNFADQVTMASRLSDLVVFGPLKEGDRPGLTEAFEATLLETGRPVLLTANPAPPTFCRKIALAWNQSVASAHAVTAALPFLKCAESVEILCVSRSKDEPIDSAELKEYLALQGTSATERHVEAGSRAVGDVLLEEAIKGGAGLLVAGGYGHSRLRELFFSGVTSHVVSHAGMPLFLVH